MSLKWTPKAIRGIHGYIDADSIGTALWTDTGHSALVTADGQTVKAAGGIEGGSNYFTSSTGMVYQATGFTGSLPCLYSNAAAGLTGAVNFPALANSQFAVYLSYSHDGTVNKVLWCANTATNTVYTMPRTNDYMISMGTGNSSGAFNQAVSVANTPEILAVRYDGQYFFVDFNRSTFRRSIGGGQNSPKIAKSGSTGLSGLPLIVGAYTANDLKPVIKIRDMIAVARCPGPSEHADIMGYLAEKTPAVNTPFVCFMGDSLTNSYDPNTTNPYADADTYPVKLSALLTADGISHSIMRSANSGKYLYQADADYDYDVRPHLWRQSGKRNIVVVWFGANDLESLGGTALLAAVRERCNRITADGGIPIPCTLMNRSDHVGFDTLRLAYNITLRNAHRQFAPAMIDFGADAIMGTSAAPDDTDLFTDGCHPTATIGNGHLARIAFPVIKAALASTHGSVDFTPGSVTLSTGTFRSAIP